MLFGKKIKYILSGIEDVIIFIDDIGVTWETYEIHLKRLKQVLDCPGPSHLNGIRRSLFKEEPKDKNLPKVTEILNSFQSFRGRGFLLTPSGSGPPKRH